MNARIEKEFKKGFLLKEEHIRKLKDIISKRLQEKKVTEDIGFEILRVDNLVYKTKEIDDVLREENSKRNLISEMKLYFANEDHNVNIIIKKNGGISLLIESEDRDFSYLIYSDIKDYIETEILIFRAFSFSESLFEKIALPIALLVVMVFSLSLGQNSIDKSQIERALQNNDINAKLNTLIVISSDRLDTSKMWKSMIFSFVAVIGVLALLPLLDKAYPRNIFYIGKEIEIYDKHCDIRSKVIWGIVIALIIGILAGLFVYYVTTKRT